MVKTISKKAMQTIVLTMAMLILVSTAVSASGAAAIMFFMADSTNISAGETVTFTIRTNAATNHVWAEVNGTTVSASLMDDNARTGQMTWAVSVRPNATQTIRINAGVSARRSDSNIQIPIVVAGTIAQPPTTPSTEHNIYSITEIEAIRANSVTLQIVTGNNSNYVWVRFDGGRYVIARLVSESAGLRTWELTYRPQQFVRHVIQVSANGTYVVSGAANQTFNVQLSAPFIPPANPMITSANASPNRIIADRATEITQYAQTMMLTTYGLS